MAHDGPSPLEQAIGRDALERYERALARLKPEDQEATLARVEMGYTYQEWPMPSIVGRLSRQVPYALNPPTASAVFPPTS